MNNKLIEIYIEEKLPRKSDSETVANLAQYHDQCQHSESAGLMDQNQ